MPSTAPLASEARTYYPKNRTMLLIIGCSTLALAAYLLSTLLAPTVATRSMVDRLSFLIPLIAGICSLAIGLTSKLQLSPAGVDYYHLGLHATTSWDNIERIGPPLVGPAILTVIRLRQPARIVWVWLSAGYHEKVIQFPLIGYNISKTSALWREFQHYAPHILP